MKSILYIQNVPYFFHIIIINYCVASKKIYFLSTQTKWLYVKKNKNVFLSRILYKNIRFVGF